MGKIKLPFCRDQACIGFTRKLYGKESQRVLSCMLCVNNPHMVIIKEKGK